MSDLLKTLKDQGFKSSSSNSEKREDTVNRSKNSIKAKKIESNFTEEDFENVTGLPSKMKNLTIFELVKRYGGEMQLKNWADILSKIMTAEEKDQKTRERRNELVEKDFIISNVKKYLDLFLSNLFDLSESQKPLISAHYKTDPEKAEFKIQEMRNKAYTKISREAVKSINQSLKGLKKKYDKTDD